MFDEWHCKTSWFQIVSQRRSGSVLAVNYCLIVFHYRGENCIFTRNLRLWGTQYIFEVLICDNFCVDLLVRRASSCCRSLRRLSLNWKSWASVAGRERNTRTILPMVCLNFFYICVFYILLCDLLVDLSWREEFFITKVFGQFGRL